MTIHRRTALRGMLAGSALLAAPAVLRGQGAPMKIGFLTVKTGPLASGGIQMEQGLTLYLKPCRMGGAWRSRAIPIDPLPIDGHRARGARSTHSTKE